MHRETFRISRVIKPPLLPHRVPSPVIPRSSIVRPDGTLNARRLPSEFPNCESSNARASRTSSRAYGRQLPGRPAGVNVGEGKCYSTRRLGLGSRALMYRPARLR